MKLCPTNKMWIFPHLYSRQMRTEPSCTLKGRLEIDNRRVDNHPLPLSFLAIPFLLTFFKPCLYFNLALCISQQQPLCLRCQNPHSVLVLSYEFLSEICSCFPSNTNSFFFFLSSLLNRPSSFTGEDGRSGGRWRCPYFYSKGFTKGA